MARFKGEYEHSIDSKGRVSFPAKLRKYLNPKSEDRFTILKGLEQCLYLYPEDEWELVENKLNSINSFTQKGRLVKRNFLRFAEDISLDNQKRLALPSKLMEWAGLSNRAIFIGSGEKVEIWAPEVLEKIDEDLDFHQYQQTFENVMGDVDQE